MRTRCLNLILIASILFGAIAFALPAQPAVAQGQAPTIPMLPLVPIEVVYDESGSVASVGALGSVEFQITNTQLNQFGLQFPSLPLQAITTIKQFQVQHITIGKTGRELRLFVNGERYSTLRLEDGALTASEQALELVLPEALRGFSGAIVEIGRNLRATVVLRFPFVGTDIPLPDLNRAMAAETAVATPPTAPAIDTEVRAKLDELIEGNARIKGKLDTLLEQNAALQQEAEELREKAESVQAEQQDANSQLLLEMAALRDENAELAGQVSELTAEVEALHTAPPETEAAMPVAAAPKTPKLLTWQGGSFPQGTSTSRECWLSVLDTTARNNSGYQPRSRFLFSHPREGWTNDHQGIATNTALQTPSRLQKS